MYSEQAEKQAGPLTLDEVVRLGKAGFSDELVITRIKKSGKPFDLSTDELIELRKTGVTETVIRYLLDPSLPYSPPPPPQPVSPSPSGNRPDPPAPVPGAPARQYPPDPHAGAIPADSGVYRVVAEAPAKIEIRMLLGVNEGAGLGKVLMKKGKVTAYLVGAASKTRVQNPAPVFYLRLPDGKAIEEVALLALDRKSDRREIEMGPPGPKPEIKAEAMRPFDSVEVGLRLFKLTLPKLDKGEYFFFLLGSAEPPKGNYGKGYDFAIDEPLPPQKGTRPR